MVIMIIIVVCVIMIIIVVCAFRVEGLHLWWLLSMAIWKLCEYFWSVVPTRICGTRQGIFFAHATHIAEPDKLVTSIMMVVGEFRLDLPPL